MPLGEEHGHPGPGRERLLLVRVSRHLRPEHPVADAHGERELADAGVVGVVLHLGIWAEGGHRGVPHPAYRHRTRVCPRERGHRDAKSPAGVDQAYRGSGERRRRAGRAVLRRPRARRSGAQRGRGRRLRDTFPDPGRHHPAAARRPRRRRPRPDRHRQDRGVRAADPVPPRPVAEDAPGARARAHPRAGAPGVRGVREVRRRTRRACTCCPSTAARATASSSPRCAAASTSSSARPAGSWTTSTRARSTSPSCASWSSTRPTRCSTWASPRTSRRSSPTPPTTSRWRCSRRPCPRRSGGSRRSTCTTRSRSPSRARPRPPRTSPSAT